MIVRAAMMLIAGYFCLAPGEAEAGSKDRPKRVAAFDVTSLTAPMDGLERLRNWRAARWSLGNAPEAVDDGSNAGGIKWRLRGAGVKVRMPIALWN